MSGDKKAQGAFREPVVRRTGNFQDLYANNTRIGITPWDMALSFGRVVVEAGPPSVEEFAEVRLSPQSFKALIKSMNHILTEWEKQFGSINTPESLFVTGEQLKTFMQSKIDQARKQEE